MPLNREVIKTLDEKDFVTSLIMSDKCCQRLVPYIKLSYFDVDYARTVVSWVIEYFTKFKHAPKNDISSVYRVHCDEIQDEALKELVLNYIQELGKNDIPINNEEYLLDKSKDFLDYKALKQYTEDLNACLDTKSMDKARKIQSEYKKVSTVELNEADLMDVNDIGIIQEALDESEEELFELPFALSRVIGKIHRNDFIAILSRPKGGKSFFLQYLGIQAMKQGLNVVFISMEMSRAEVIKRIWKSLWGSESGLVKEGIYESCRSIEDSCEEGKYRSELIDVSIKDKTKPVEELQKRLKMNNNYSGTIKIIAYPRFGASVIEITNRIDNLMDDGFIPDVIIIDYADITKPIGGGSELRNQLDEIWKYLGGYAMKTHTAVITASQTNRSGMSASSISADMIGENFKKIAHVTSMVSLESTPKMKESHLQRVRNLAIRNENVEEACVFPQCLELGQFIFGQPVLSKNFIYDLSDDEEED